MKGKGFAFGAVSIVNAIATGKGAALGIRLKTEAEVELIEGSEEIDIKIMGCDCERDKTLGKYIVKEVLAHFKHKNYGAKVTTKSEIPIGKGLKSSSVAANAIVLAIVSSLREELDDFTLINLGVNSSIKAGVTITGAFDDACASFFGGLVVTDNKDRIIKRREILMEKNCILIYVPPEKAYTKDVDVIMLNNFKSLFEEANLMVMRGKYWDAMVLNGLACSTALGFSTKPMMSALSAGAICAGLSGTGPAVSAVCSSDKVDDIISVWSNLPGEVISTRINNEKARMVD